MAWGDMAWAKGYEEKGAGMERLECDRMFVAVFESGSFARAAERLGTSSSQASKLVARLEQILDVQLFKRSTRALAVTDIGHAYYERIKVLLEEFDALDAAVRQTADEPSGRLRLSVPVTFGTTCLTPLLIAFARQYPLIELDVRYADRLVNIVDEGFDLALRIGKLDDSRLMARKLCPIRVMTLASPHYLQARGTPAHWQDLAAHDCIIDTNFRDPFSWHFQDENGQIQLLPLRGRLRFSNAEACVQAALAGLGIVRVPTFVAGDQLRSGALVPILKAYDVPPIALYAVYPPARHLANKTRVIIDYLAEAFSGQPAWEQGWAMPTQD